MTGDAAGAPRHSLLPVEEAAAILITRQCAGVGAAKNAIAAAGDGIVGRIAEKPGQKLQEEGGWAPEASELLEDEEGGVGAGEQRFVGEIVVEDYVDRVQIGGVDAVAGEDAGGGSALQRGETEDGMAVAAKDELDEAVAKSADAVVEEDGVRHASRKTLAAWA